MKRAYYDEPIAAFAAREATSILGQMAAAGSFSLDTTQRDAWLVQIAILQRALTAYCDRGWVYFEYSIPRLGKRIDAVLLIDHVLFVVEFKVGETEYISSALDQVCDYALDLKNFHETSHQLIVAPVLIATEAPVSAVGRRVLHDDRLLYPLCTNAAGIADTLSHVLANTQGTRINATTWSAGAGTTLPQRSLRPPQPSTQVTRSRTYREATRGPPILAGHPR